MSKYQVTVLCEDESHQRFVRRYLLKTGFKKHEVILIDLPPEPGDGGARWILDRYANAVRAQRHRAARVKTGLIVVIDGDNYGINGRTRQLAKLLEEARLDPRTASELIVHLIPQRNIETWILYLTGQKVDETENWKAPSTAEMIPNAAAALHELVGAVPPDCLPSLRAGAEELKRLP